MVCRRYLPVNVLYLLHVLFLKNKSTGFFYICVMLILFKSSQFFKCKKKKHVLFRDHAKFWIDFFCKWKHTNEMNFDWNMCYYDGKNNIWHLLVDNLFYALLLLIKFLSHSNSNLGRNLFPESFKKIEALYELYEIHWCLTMYYN